jgi:transposase
MQVPALKPYSPDNPNCVVVLDNASIHYDDRVRAAIERTGAKLLFLP